jgi:hypothetical protein
MSSIYTGCSTDTLVAIPNECLNQSFAQATRLIFTKLEDGGTANTRIATAADAHLIASHLSRPLLLLVTTPKW